MDDSIPVCTLFKEDGVGEQDDITNIKINKNDVLEKSSENLPSTVCDIFQNSPSTENAFENISNIPEHDVSASNDSINLNTEGLDQQIILEDTNKSELTENTENTDLKEETLNIQSSNIANADETINLSISDSFENISDVSALSEDLQIEATPMILNTQSSSKNISSIYDDSQIETIPKVDANPSLGQEHDNNFEDKIDQVPLASALFSQIKDNNNSSCDDLPFEIKINSVQIENDAFTSALSNSETCRRRDAWIPKETTQQVLSTVARTQKAIKLEPSHLTRPGLGTSESLGDPVKAVLAKFKGMEFATTREMLNVGSVSFDEKGLCKLIDSGNLRAAIDLTGQMLTKMGQGFGKSTQPSENTEMSLKWWYIRLSLLNRLKLYDLAETELLPFGDLDSPNLYYGFYPDLYPGRKGSMVPFCFRMLHANFHRHKNQPQKSLSELYSMKEICLKIIRNLEYGKSEDGSTTLKEDDKDLSLMLWKKRVLKIMNYIGNTLLQMKEYHVAFKAFDDIVELNPSDAVLLGSGVGRAMLQLGDIKAAQQKFASIEKIAAGDPTQKFQILLNRGFLYVGANNWKEALVQFNEVLKLEPNNIEALNNKAVCLLYLCRLKEAIFTLENAVKLRIEVQEEQPISSQVNYSNSLSFEGALSNLVTLYELESSRFMAKKQLLLQHVSRISGDGFDVSCLKM